MAACPVPLDPAAFALVVAEQAARSVRCSVGMLLRRDKSRGYLLKRLRAEYPHLGADELRGVVDELRRAHRGTEPVFDTTPLRRATAWREPVSDPAWDPRAVQLAGLLAEPTDMPALLARAASALGWERNRVIQAAAAAEAAGLVEWTEGAWRLPELEETNDMAEHPQSQPQPAPTNGASPAPNGKAATPEAEAERRAKIAQASKARHATRRATNQESGPTLEDALAPIVRKLVRAELGRIVGELLSGAAK